MAPGLLAKARFFALLRMTACGSFRVGPGGMLGVNREVEASEQQGQLLGHLFSGFGAEAGG